MYQKSKDKAKRMRNKLLYLLVAIVELYGCSLPKEKQEKTFAYGYYKKADGKDYIVTDKGNKIALKNSTKADDYKDKYCFVAGEYKKLEQNTYTGEMEIEMIEESVIYPINKVKNTDQIKNFGKEGIDFTNNLVYSHVYFSGKHLNFIYSISSANPRNNVISYIVEDNKTEFSANRFTIYIRHKDNNPISEAKRMFQVYSSVDMTDIIKQATEKKISLMINYLDLSDKVKEDVYEITIK